MDWINKNPIKKGKYVVETITTMGTIKRLESYWNGRKWSFTNQIFRRYLFEN